MIPKYDSPSPWPGCASSGVFFMAESTAASPMPIQPRMRSGLLSRPDHYAAVVSQSSDECFATTPSKPGKRCRSQAGGSVARLGGDVDLAACGDSEYQNPSHAF